MSSAGSSFGSPLQQIAMGLVIVVGRALLPSDPSPGWAHYDALPDPVGWLLVLSGTFGLARADAAFASTRWLAALAGIVSVPMWLPQLSHRLEESAQWFVSLPQIAFCLVLALTIGRTGADRQPPDTFVAKRFGLLVWGFAVVGVLPIVALGGGVHWLRDPTLVVSTIANVVLIYLLFRVHAREWLGGPGPRHPGRERARG